MPKTWPRFSFEQMFLFVNPQIFVWYLHQLMQFFALIPVEVSRGKTLCEESKEAFAVSLIVFPDEQKFTNLSQTSSTFTKIYNCHHGSVTITIPITSLLTILLPSPSTWLIPSSQLHSHHYPLLRGSCRKQEEKLLWFVWTHPDPNDPNDTNDPTTDANTAT